MTNSTVVLTQADLDQLAAMRNAAQSRPTFSKNYWQIYQTLADKLVSVYGQDQDDPTVLWLRGATQANKGDGAFFNLIREYTNTQYDLRYNQELNHTAMQRASDQVA